MAVTSPIVDAGHDGVGRPGPARTLTVRRPASVAIAHVAGARPCVRAIDQAWARQRMPLPLISARLPSALNSAMPRSASVAAAASGRRSGRRRRCPAVGRTSAGQHLPRAAGRSGWSSNTTRKSLPRPWCFVSFTRTGRASSSRTSSAAVEVVVAGDRHPADAGVAAEPALLAHGEPPGAGDGGGDGLVQRALAVEVGEQLLVAEGLARGAGQRLGPGGERGDLGQEAGGQLGGEALLDAPRPGRRAASAARPGATATGG